MSANYRDGIPKITRFLPEFMDFILVIGKEIKDARIQSLNDLRFCCDIFFTPERMQAVEKYIPGWMEMARYADGQTLYHIVCALIALLALPEYQAALPAQQELLEWVVLLHDIAKKPRAGARDHLHGFHCGVAAARLLPALGFAMTEEYPGVFDMWSTTTHEAYCIKDGIQYQDNGKLPAILEGIDQMFGLNTPGALIVKTVLLHISVDGVKEWPNPTPLTPEEQRRFVDLRLLECLRIMALVDSDAWELFNRANKARFHREILATFENWEEVIVNGRSQ